MFSGAPGAKKFYKAVIGNWAADTTSASIKALKKYAASKADGVKQSDALDAATREYQTAIVAVQDEIPF
jgi:hypothetical protein